MRPRHTRPGRRAIAAAAALSLAGGLVTAASIPAHAEETEDLASRFTLAVLPDTQFYSRYTADQFMPRYGNNPFAVQTEWLAENSDALNIPFVTHLGDVVDRATVADEWHVADNAMQTLEDANLPYSILAGNHDVLNSNDQLDDTDYNLENEPFLQWFSPERAAEQSTFGGSDPTGMSQYHVFEAEGQQFMVLALSWRVSEDTQAWAESVIQANPTVPVILTTHSLLSVESDQVTPLETAYGLELWENLIRENDQIFLTMNGHFHGATRLEKSNDYGHTVTEILIDYQMAYDGGNGYLGLYEFDLTNNKINVQTASPWVVSKAPELLTSYDQPFLEGAQQQFTIEIDFAERFAGFNPTFTAGTADEASLSAAARTLLLTGFDAPDAITTELPGDARDFVEVEGTLAHWRFNDNEGVVDANMVIEDVAGDNDLHRADPTATGATGATWEDAFIETESVPAFSADGAAVCFANADRNENRFSYLTTEAGAPITNADLSNGYTIETFVKMDPDWTAEANQWSKFITRTGNRSTIEGVPWSRWDYTSSPTALGISNLREFQFTSIPADTPKGDKTNWSGEILTGSWAHVALVNDPATMSTTMYVDGAPVLRNATGTAGMAFNSDMPWILGADWVDDAATGGWNGCIGETRIIDRPTTPEEWLTQRADLSDLTVGTAPEGMLQADVDSVLFAGTGFPGADVTVAELVVSSGMSVRSAGDLSGASTVVEADGSWQIEVTSGLTAGEHSVTLTQSLGSRAALPTIVNFAIAEPATEPVDPEAPVDPSEPVTPTDPSDPADAGESPDDAAQADPAADSSDDLAVTGTDATVFWTIAAMAMSVIIAGAVLLTVMRRRAQV
ncbi:LamG-like jellyroll fold domain-containing protein [Microbacterium marmarense]|uniref:LamG-like jellyroll fold domain-containing protein n=1 Tax=Microbacterium marmarense TaxID=3122051 RepID=A0ABU8LV40_9MICO